MRTLAIIGGLILLVVGGIQALGSPDYSSSPPTAVDKTLSPYFYVEGGDPAVDRIPLESTKASVLINGVIAEVTITQRYRNEGKKPINARYVFPASTRAAVHAMTMRIGENTIRARIQEREAAKRTFEAAKQQGKSASLLEQERPNVFSMSVANIMPGDVVDIELGYSELLVPTEGIYEFVYPTVVGPRYSEQPEGTAPESERWVENPYLRQGKESPATFDIDVGLSTALPLSALDCPSHQTGVQWDGMNAATVSLHPAEQGAGGNRDFILRYRLDGEQIQSGVMLYEEEGEKFFLLMLQPPQRVATEQIPAREYVFVVDVSGSMKGWPLDVSKKLLEDLIGGLRPSDTFNVVLFAGSSELMSKASVPATRENIESALSVIDKHRGGGGTRLAAGLGQALALPRTKDMSRSVIVVTDGYIDAEADVFRLIHDNLESTNVFAFGIGSSVNRHLVEGIARAGLGEPFVVTSKEEGREASARFRSYVGTPVLTQVAFDAGDALDVFSVEPHALPDMLAERPIIVCGKYRGQPKGTIQVTGRTGAGPWSESVDVASVTPTEANHALRYLWARTRIAALSDHDFGRPDEERVREVTTLGLTYNLLTRYTSFVAVLDQVRNAEGVAENVTQPLPMPSGVSDQAVGARGAAAAAVPRRVAVTSTSEVRESSGVVSGDEPELALLATLLALLGGFHFLRRRIRTARV